MRRFNETERDFGYLIEMCSVSNSDAVDIIVAKCGGSMRPKVL